MVNKRTPKKTNISTRIVKKVPTAQIISWKALFKAFGTKTDFENKHGISRQTINNILKNKQGEERVIKAITVYHKKHIQKASV